MSLLKLILYVCIVLTMYQPDLFEKCTPKEFVSISTLYKGELCGWPDISELFELSVDAYYAALYARMSELPLSAEISRFIEKVLKAGRSFPNSKCTEARVSAARTASDLGDPDVSAVKKAACKVQHEINRLTGFLRFNPDPNGVYTARCGPDHNILPALAEHFYIRFGEIPWVIIDEKRHLCLYREIGNQPKLLSLSAFLNSEAAGETQDDYWEDLWKLYHSSVNNETRKNLRLQHQFMPQRYHKYLPEVT